MNEQQSSSTQGDSGNVYAAPAARVDDVIPAGEMELAGRGTRLVAAIIDGIIMMVTAIATAMVLGINLFSATAQPSFMAQAGLGLANIVWYLVINWNFLSKNGQSVGKKVMGVKIVRTDGTKADVQRIVGLRLVPIWVVSIIPVVGTLVALVDCLLIFRESRKCLHDNIADTIVIKA
ncbi:MAG: RDD family protein [Betaproteobacteria bacterium]|nr:RDD family protein [Betaproteobacteria bacterium]